MPGPRNKVFIRESSYEYSRLRDDAFDILDLLGAGRLCDGAKVLIKPNLLAAARPGQAVTTHPMLVRAASEYAIERGARVVVGDSPPMGSFEKIVSVTGLRDALKGLDVELRELGRPVSTRVSNKFRDVLLSADALGADLIINLPKLKTHSQMGLTLATKNLFGCVVGLSKAEWHLKVGENTELFAELIVSIFGALPRSVHLMDAILAMQGDGPGTGGTPRELGVLMGSTNAAALDEAVCRMVGLNPEELLTLGAARKLHLAGPYEIDGPVPRVKGFEVPASEGVLFGPVFLRKFLRHRLTTRPECEAPRCEMCGECIKVCPAKAIGDSGGKLSFDYDKCIRCYCCLEVCTHGALRKHKPLLGRIMQRLFRARHAQKAH